MKVGPLFETIVCCDISLFTDMSCALVTPGSVDGRKLTSNKTVPDADSYMTYYTCVLSLFVYEPYSYLCEQFPNEQIPIGIAAGCSR